MASYYNKEKFEREDEHMKVAVIVNELTVRGGTHKQVLRLCQYLEKKEIDFVLCTKYYDPDNTYPEFAKYNPLYLYISDLPLRKSSKNIFSKVKHQIEKYKEDKKLYALLPKDIDIINIHDNWLERINKLAKNNHKKVVWQINDINGIFGVGVSEIGRNSLQNQIKKFLYLRNIEKTDVITVNVTKNAERVKKCFNKHASVLHCGVDVNDTLVKHSFAGHNEFRILSMGVFFPYRNYETLINVVKVLKEQGNNVRLDIIGKTDYALDYYKAIQHQISENHLDNYVKIWGQVDDNIYSELFNKADIFAFINIEQSWGLAVFEAMSTGIPTIVSNSVGATELLHNDEDAIILNPKSVDEICRAIKRLMTDEKYYNRISDEAARVVKEFSWDKLYSSKMLDIFKKLSEEK